MEDHGMSVAPETVAMVCPAFMGAVLVLHFCNFIVRFAKIAS
jgi:hypothetical protein